MVSIVEIIVAVVVGGRLSGVAKPEIGRIVCVAESESIGSILIRVEVTNLLNGIERCLVIISLTSIQGNIVVAVASRNSGKLCGTRHVRILAV